MGSPYDQSGVPGRGETMSGTIGVAGTTSDIAITEYTAYEGIEKWFDDINWNASDAVKPKRSHLRVKCRLVRNTSSNVLLTKRLCVLGKDAVSNAQTAVAGPLGKARVVGYAIKNNAVAFPIDEFLSGPIKVNDLFWIVLEGPAMCLIDLADLSADVDTGMLLFGAVTGAVALATSTAATAGRIDDGVALTSLYSLGATTAADYTAVVLGQAMSSLALASTDNDILVDIGSF